MRRGLAIRLPFLFAAVILFVITAPGLAQGPHEGAPDPGEEAARKRFIAAQFDFERTFPGKRMRPDLRAAAVEAKERIAVSNRASGISPSLTFTSIGPSPLAAGFAYAGPFPVSGRVSAIAIASDRTIYAGGAQGGVWRSRDNGGHWQPLMDDEISLAVGSITIDPADPKTIYVGTGEQSFACSSYFGAGILKSTDGGDSWTRLGAGVFTGRTIGEVIVQHPSPGQTTLYANSAVGLYGRGCDPYLPAPRRGVYKSTDGGETWRQLTKGLPRAVDGTPDRSATDLVIDPGDANRLFVGFYAGGVWSTEDDGEHWSEVTGGLPTENTGRVALAIAPTDGNRMYAAYESFETGDVLGLYRSDDGGATWAPMATPSPPPPGYDIVCQCFYDNYLRVSPTDPDTVFWGAIDLWRTDDGGLTWTNVARGEDDPVGRVHVDQHALAFVPGNSRAIVIGNDGGVYGSGDNGNSWVGLNATLSITQFVDVTAHPGDPEGAIGGTQDNGTIRYRGETTWLTLDGGDGGDNAINPDRPNVMYHTYFLTYLVRSTNGGTTWQAIYNGIRGLRSLFYVPFTLDRDDPDTLFIGTQFVNRSRNRGENWRKISPDLTRGYALSSIHVSAADHRVVWAGSADGLVHRRANRGMWSNVTGLLPKRFVAAFASDARDADTAYVAYTGFEAQTPRRPGHVFLTEDGGNSWENRTYDLPDIAINDLALDPVDGTLYAATDVGVFELPAGARSWVVSGGLPNVAVFSLSLNRETGVVYAGTHGRGAFVALLPGG